MQLFLKEKQLYFSILRKFPPVVFLRVLIAFIRIIKLTINKINYCFKEGGLKGLRLVLLKGVAAFN